MTRFPATRTLTTALLGALLAVGGIAPAFAQQRDDGQDKHVTKPSGQRDQPCPLIHDVGQPEVTTTRGDCRMGRVAHLGVQLR